MNQSLKTLIDRGICMSKASQLLEILKDPKDKWRVHVDDHTKTFTVYRGSDDICGGYFNPEDKRINNIEFMDKHYQKNNKIRIKAMDMIKKTFPGYK